MCVSVVMLGEFSLSYGYAYILLDVFGCVRDIDLHFFGTLFLSVDPPHSIESVKIIVLQTLHVTLCVCVHVCSAASITCVNIVLQSACIHYSRLRVVLLFRSCSRDMSNQCYKNLRPLQTPGHCVVQRDLSLRPY